VSSSSPSCAKRRKYRHPYFTHSRATPMDTPLRPPQCLLAPDLFLSLHQGCQASSWLSQSMHSANDKRSIRPVSSAVHPKWLNTSAIRAPTGNSPPAANPVQRPPARIRFAWSQRRQILPHRNQAVVPGVLLAQPMQCVTLWAASANFGMLRRRRS